MRAAGDAKTAADAYLAHAVLFRDSAPRAEHYARTGLRLLTLGSGAPRGGLYVASVDGGVLTRSGETWVTEGGGGAAAAADLKPGIVLTHYAEQPLRSSADLPAAVRSAVAGEAVTVSYLEVPDDDDAAPQRRSATVRAGPLRAVVLPI